MSDAIDFLWRAAIIASSFLLLIASPLFIGQGLEWTSQGMTHFAVSPVQVSSFLYVCLMIGAYGKQKRRLTYKVTRDTWLINILIACAVPFTAWNLFTNV